MSSPHRKSENSCLCSLGFYWARYFFYVSSTTNYCPCSKTKAHQTFGFGSPGQRYGILHYECPKACDGYPLDRENYRNISLRLCIVKLRFAAREAKHVSGWLLTSRYLYYTPYLGGFQNREYSISLFRVSVWLWKWITKICHFWDVLWLSGNF